MGTSRERVSGLEEVEEEVEDRRHHQHREAGRLERNRKGRNEGGVMNPLV